MHESKGQHTGKAPCLHLYKTQSEMLEFQVAIVYVLTTVVIQ